MVTAFSDLHGRRLYAAGAGSRVGTARRTVKAVSGAGLARHLDGAAHRLGQLLHDRETEPGTDGPLAAVTLVQIEALEGALPVLDLEARAGVLDAEHTGSGDDADRAAARGQPKRVLDEIRDDLQHAIRIGNRGRRCVGGCDERHTENVGLLLVAPHGVLRHLRKIDLARMDAEVGAVHAREIEQVADEPLEPRGLADDGGRDVLGFQRTVLQRLRVAANGGERRLELVADREQERLLRLASARQLLGEIVERNRERRQLGRSFRGNGLRSRATCEAPRGLRDTMHGSRDSSREQERSEGGKRAAHERGDEQAVDERREASTR